MHRIAGLGLIAVVTIFPAITLAADPDPKQASK
jgi:hypothetical protein